MLKKYIIEYEFIVVKFKEYGKTIYRTKKYN